MTTQLTTETFAKSIQNGVSFIDFGAQWCPPCRMMEPVVEELSQDFDGKVRLLRWMWTNHKIWPISLAFVLSQ